jgi:hypothetical protein
MNTSPTGGKTMFCGKCKHQHCPLGYFTSAFQQRICPIVHDIKQESNAAFKLHGIAYETIEPADLVTAIKQSN